MYSVKLGVLIGGLLLAAVVSISAKAQSITLKTNSTKIATSKSGSPPAPVITTDTYKSSPSGDYDTGTVTGVQFLIVLETGHGTTVGTFTSTIPPTYPVLIATGQPQPGIAVSPTAVKTAWSIPSAIAFYFGISTPPGPGNRAMRAQLQQQNAGGLGYTTVQTAVVPLP